MLGSRRLRIDQWLRSHLRLGDLHGLEWIGRPEDGLFAVNWSHKSLHTWDLAERQNNIFLAYCSYRDGRQRHATVTAKDYKQLKQNFRCALRGSRHIRHEAKLSRSRGCEARRVYRFVEADAGCSSGCEGDTSSSNHTSSNSRASLPELNVDTDLLELENLDAAAVSGSHSNSSEAASGGADDLSDLTDYILQDDHTPMGDLVEDDLGDLVEVLFQDACLPQAQAQLSFADY